MNGPDLECRHNPGRAIFVAGEINEALYNEIAPQIIKLRHESREPITVYINSRGGSVVSQAALLNLLQAGDQDGRRPCRIITVALSLAASAAAELLAAGDYALVHPDSTVLFHGTRFHKETLTAEDSTLWADALRESNEDAARNLTHKIEFRFMFRFITSKPYFNEIRSLSSSGEQLSDLDCFIVFISRKLSPPAKEILANARGRHARYDQLFQSAAGGSAPAAASRADKEALRIKAIVDFELRMNANNEDWSFGDGGMKQLVEDVSLLNEYMWGMSHERFNGLCKRWSFILLGRHEMNEIESSPKEVQENMILDKCEPIFRPIWSFFVALCHALQQGENRMTAEDAYWLGLVDEIIGDQDSASYRILIENSNIKPA